MNKVILIGLIFFSTFTTAIAETARANSWTGWSKIDLIYPSGNMNFTLRSINFPGGSCNGGRQYYFSPSDANYDVKVKVLLSAFLAGREIKIVWDGTGRCFGHVDRFQIR